MQLWQYALTLSLDSDTIYESIYNDLVKQYPICKSSVAYKQLDRSLVTIAASSAKKSQHKKLIMSIF